jgi:hypothetical protein
MMPVFDRLNEGRRQKAEGRRQEAVFVTGIYTPLQKLFALKGEVLDPIVLIINAVARLGVFLKKDSPFSSFLPGSW